MAATGWVKDVFSGFEFVKGIIPLPEMKSFTELKHSVKAIRPHRFDIGLLLTNSFSSALLFSRAKIPERWGYKKDLRTTMLTRAVSPPGRMSNFHQVEYYLHLLSGLGLRPTAPRLSFPLKTEEKRLSDALLKKYGRSTDRPLVVFSPGASYGPSKRWPAGRFGELGSLLQKKHSVDLAVIGSADEAPLADEIASCLNQEPMILTGKLPLRQAAGVVSQAAVFVTNDSGPMHLANALGVPVVAIFGPTDPQRTGPFQEPSSVLKKDAPCSPCLYRKCPFDHPCMTGILPSEALAACEEYLA